MVKKAGVRIVKPSVFADDHERTPEQLREHIPTIKQYKMKRIKRDWLDLARLLSSFRSNKVYKFFGPTWDGFVQDELGVTPNWTQQVIRGGRLLGDVRAEWVDVWNKDTFAWEHMPNLKKGLIRTVRNVCKEVVEFDKEWTDYKLWEQFAPSWGECLRDTLDTDPKWIAAVIKAEEILRTEKVVESGPKPAPQQRKEATAIARKILAVKSADIEKVNTKKLHGSNPEYLAVRIAKVAPEVHAKLKAGEYPSIRAAALAAGIIQDRKQITMTTNSDPEKIAQNIFNFDIAMATAIMESLQDRIKAHSLQTES